MTVTLTRTRDGYAFGDWTICGPDASGAPYSRYAHMNWTLFRAGVFVRHFRRLADARMWIASVPA